MIYEINSSLVEALESNSNSAVEFLEDLAFGRKKGRIAILISKKLCIKVVNCPYSPSHVKAIFKRENQDATFTFGFLSQIRRKFICCHSEFLIDDIQLDEYQKKIDIKGYELNESNEFNSFFDKPKLFVEHSINDGELIKVICDYTESQIVNNSLFTLSFDYLHGGGATTHHVYQGCEYDKRNVFGIVDNDKKSPFCKLGDTALNLRSAFSSNKFENQLFIGRFSEIENLIPLEVYLEVARETQMLPLKFLGLTSEINPESYLYYDFKNSFSYGSIYTQKLSYSSYWLPLFLDFEANLTIKKSMPNNKLLPSIGVLREYATQHLRNSLPKNICNPELRVEWESIGKWLLEIGICSKRISA